MSLLGNHDNDFEKKLKKHLGDTEYKPAESLWDRIDKEVNKPEFEQKVEGKIGRYELKPKPETWEYIEAHLPPEPKSWKRTGKLWYSLIALLFLGGGFLGYQLNTVDNKQVLAGQDQPVILDEPAKDVIVKSPATAVIPKEEKGPETISAFEQSLARPANVSSQPAHTEASTALTSPARVEEKTTPARDRKLQSGSAIYLVNAVINPPAPEVNNRERPAAVSPAPQEQINAVDAGNIADKPTLTSIPAVEHEAAGTQARTSASNGNVPGQVVSEPLAQPEQSQENAASKSMDEKDIAPESGPVGPQQQDTSSPAAVKPESDGKPVTQLSDSTFSAVTFTPIDAIPPVKLSISIMAGIHQSNMRLVAPAGMEQNKTVREKVETPEWDFTGGFLLDYKVNDRILISSGIILSGFSMGMSYNKLPSDRSARIEPGATYENSTDSIVPGNVASNRIKYSWSEIPLFVTYKFKTKKRVGLEMRGGVSYAIIGTVDAAMVGQDNIGVLAMKTQEAFPVFRNTVFAHLYAGISYKLNETVSLNAMPYARYSINSMVKTEKWIQQHPWMTGLSVGLRKSF